jgi:hypothetical protein
VLEAGKLLFKIHEFFPLVGFETLYKSHDDSHEMSSPE